MEIEPVEIARVERATPDVVAAIGRLLPQLSSSSAPPSAADIAEIVDNPGSVLFVARLGGEIVGTLTLATFRIPTGVRAWIEDVVVDDAARGRGLGNALTVAALDAAEAMGAKTVELTSRPSREAANAMYVKLGFQRRETNVYRFSR